MALLKLTNRLQGYQDLQQAVIKRKRKGGCMKPTKKTAKKKERWEVWK